MQLPRLVCIPLHPPYMRRAGAQQEQQVPDDQIIAGLLLLRETSVGELISLILGEQVTLEARGWWIFV